MKTPDFYIVRVKDEEEMDHLFRYIQVPEQVSILNKGIYITPTNVIVYKNKMVGFGLPQKLTFEQWERMK